tara:strand:+ start:43 stop:345 length:303 start_codon:yes stop_codon:yes gene_type:complete
VLNVRESRFGVGDLVRYYVFTTYYYGEGSVKLRGTGLILRKEFVEWSPYAQRWIDSATYGDEDNLNHGIWRYDVLCSKTGNVYDVSGKGLMIIQSAKKEE